ncbi:hypothetical protein [Streptomyces sp. NPDC091268]|uniref:hypothetical protein n=1 Tax=Streptomyces sp. NPDC091268 TaxID=3365979 RepID=UPI00381DC963
MPWTMPLRPSPSRRSLLAGAAGAAGAVLLTGCSDGGGPAEGETGIPLERRMRETAVRDSERLLERYDATTAAHPVLAPRLAPLRAAVAAHASALAVEGPAAGPGAGSATGSRAAGGSGAPGKASAAPATGAAASGGAATPAAAAPSGEPVPAQPADALAELADSERSLAEARTISLAGAPPELARVLASVAACGHVHAYLLTSTPGGTP